MQPPGLHLRQCNAALRPLNFGSDASWRASDDGAIPAEMQAFDSVALGRHPLGKIKMRDHYHSLAVAVAAMDNDPVSPPRNRDRNRNRNRLRKWICFPGTGRSLCKLHTQQRVEEPGGLGGGRAVRIAEVRNYTASGTLLVIVITAAARLWPVLWRQAKPQEREQEQEQEPAALGQFFQTNYAWIKPGSFVADGLLLGILHNAHL